MPNGAAPDWPGATAHHVRVIQVRCHFGQEAEVNPRHRGDPGSSALVVQLAAYKLGPRDAEATGDLIQTVG